MKFNLQFFAPEPSDGSLKNTKWLLNEDVAGSHLNRGNGISINFVSNGETFDSILFHRMDGIIYGTKNVFGINDNGDYVWDNEAYRTITITDGDVNNEELLDWLLTNATELEYEEPVEEEPDELWQIKKSTLKEIADAIRFRKNSTENIKVSDLATEISNITQSSGRTDIEYNKPIANDEVWQIKKSTLKGIANAIREKSGILDEFKVSTFAQKIDTMTITGEDHEEVGGAVKTYGVSWVNDASTTMTRTDDAVGMTYSLNSTDGTITSDFDNVFPYNQMTKETDEYGNVFINIPSMWFRVETEQYKIISIAVSKEKGETGNWYQSKAFKYSAYPCSLSDNKLQSISGANIMYNQTRATARTYATNVGTGYHLADLYSHTVLTFLWWIEFAVKSPTVITKDIYSSGGNFSKRTKTGVDDNKSLTYFKDSLKYRGIECFYTNQYIGIDGVTGNKVWKTIKVTSNYTQYNDNNEGSELPFSTISETGSYCSQTSSVGWVKSLPFLMYPYSVINSSGIQYFGSISSYSSSTSHYPTTSYSVGGIQMGMNASAGLSGNTVSASTEYVSYRLMKEV